MFIIKHNSVLKTGRGEGEGKTSEGKERGRGWGLNYNRVVCGSTTGGEIILCFNNF